MKKSHLSWIVWLVGSLFIIVPGSLLANPALSSLGTDRRSVVYDGQTVYQLPANAFNNGLATVHSIQRIDKHWIHTTRTLSYSGSVFGGLTPIGLTRVLVPYDGEHVTELTLNTQPNYIAQTREIRSIVDEPGGFVLTVVNGDHPSDVHRLLWDSPWLPPGTPVDESTLPSNDDPVTIDVPAGHVVLVLTTQDVATLQRAVEILKRLD